MSVAGDAAASGAALANKLAPCARRATPPTASAPVPTGVRAPITQHLTSAAGNPRVRAAAVPRAGLALVRAPRLSPLPGADVGRPQALLAHIAGVLLANRETLIRTQEAFAAAIVGGFGSLPGAVIGGLLIGIGEQFAGLYLPPGFSEVTAYAILLIMLLVRPHGILASVKIKKM